jgi:hypothetical protein
MFGLFKSRPHEAPSRKWDDPGVEARRDCLC